MSIIKAQIVLNIICVNNLLAIRFLCYFYKFLYRLGNIFIFFIVEKYVAECGVLFIL